MRLSRTALAGAVALAIAGLLSGAPGARAQGVEGCERLTNTEGPKVVVGQVSYESSTGVTESLTEKYDIRMQIELMSALRSLLPDAAAHAVLCSNRAPSNDGSDFEPEFTEALNSRDVLLELWGEIREKSSANSTTYEAQLCMMLIPVRHYDSEASEVDHHLLIYSAGGNESIEDAFIDIVLRTEFQVYTSVAYGVKALKNDDFDNAKRYLTAARILWSRAMADSSLAMTATQPEAVLEYIGSLEEQCVDAARASSTYEGDVIVVDELLEEGSG